MTSPGQLVHERPAVHAGAPRPFFLVRALTLVLLAPIRFYKAFISPLLPPVCRFHPSCSVYAMGAIGVHGPFKGLWLAARRISRCHPFNRGGLDPVPTKDGRRAEDLLAQSFPFIAERLKAPPPPHLAGVLPAIAYGASGGASGVAASSAAAPEVASPSVSAPGVSASGLSASGLSASGLSASDVASGVAASSVAASDVASGASASGVAASGVAASGVATSSSALPSAVGTPPRSLSAPVASGDVASAPTLPRT